MREATAKEFQTVLGKAGWPSPEYMFTKRTTDIYYKDRGTEVASHHKSLTRGKVTHESYMINPKYLDPSSNG